MLTSYSSILQELRRLQTNDVANAEQNLRHMCIQPSIMKLFYKIIKDQSIQEPSKKMACIYLNRLLEEQYQQLNEVFFIELVTEIIFDPDIPYHYKICLQQISESMIAWCQRGNNTFNISENVQKIVQFFQYAVDTLQNLSKSYTLKQEGSDYRIIAKHSKQTTTLNLMQSLKLNVKIQNQDQYLNLAETILFMVGVFYKSQQFQPDQIHRVLKKSFKATLQAYPIKNQTKIIQYFANLLEQWEYYFEDLKDKGEKQQNQQSYSIILQHLINEPILWQIISQIYDLGTPPNLQTKNKIYVSLQQDANQECINQLKHYACQIHKKIINFQDLSNQSHIPSESLTKNIGSHIQNVIRTLSYFSLNKDIIPLFKCQIFIKSLLGLLILICRKWDFMMQQNYWTNYLHLIIFPLLQASQDQCINFQENPEQFIAEAQDCCDHQLFQTLKSNAANFLQLICDKDIRYTQYIIQFCVISIQAQLGLIQDMVNQTSVKVLSIQQSFLILSICSYQLSKFKSMMQLLKTAFMQPKMKNLSPFQTSRIFLFLAYNYNQIFENVYQGKQWVQYALSYNIHQTTKISALDFISNISDEYFQENLVQQLANKIVQMKNLKIIWSSISKILRCNIQKISEDWMIYLVNYIFQRMDSDINAYNNKQINNTQNISNCLHIIRRIMENQAYSKEKIQLNKVIWKIVFMYDTLSKIFLQDQVLRIINQFMNQENSINQVFFQMLPNLLLQFKKNQFLSTSFILIFNQFIIKAPYLAIRSIKQVLVQGLSYMFMDKRNVAKKVRNNIATAHQLILLQNLVANHGTQMKQEQIKQIVNLCQIFLPTLIQLINENFPQTIIGRSLILMFICHMFYKNSQTFDRLLALHEENGIFTDYNANTIVKCLCKQIFRESDLVTVSEMINIIARIIQNKNKRQVVVKSKINKPSKKDTKIKIRRVQDYDIILKTINTPFLPISPIQQELKNTLNQMKENNQLLYSSIINSLPSEVRNILSQVASSKIMNSGKTRKIMCVQGAKEGNPQIQQKQQKRVWKRQLILSDDESLNDNQDMEDYKSKSKKMKKLNRKQDQQIQ